MKPSTLEKELDPQLRSPWKLILLHETHTDLKLNSTDVVLTMTYEQWRTQKVSEGGKVLLQSCDFTNQLYGECRRHNHSRVVWGHAFVIIAFAKTAWFCFTFFHFKGLRGEWYSGLPIGTLVLANVLYEITDI